MRRRAAAAAVSCAAALALVAPRASATDDDGAYGRLSGDLDLRLGAGVALADGGPSLAATASAVYLSSAGLYVAYTDALTGDPPPVRRSLAAGVHVQPLFLARYASDAEHGPAHLDLFLDSFAFQVGAFWQAQERATFDDEPGIEVALAAGVPLLASSNGPWIDVRGALRWRSNDLRRPGHADAFERGALLMVTLGWHQNVNTHLVDVGDTLKR